MPDTTPRTSKVIAASAAQARTGQGRRPKEGATGSAREVQTSSPGSSMTEADVVRLLQPVVKGTAGVAGLVPSLKAALARLRPVRSPAPTTSGADADDDDNNTSADGISVTVDGDTVAAVLDITVTRETSVLATALAVHGAATAALETTLPGPHTVTVNVLGLDPDDEQPAPEPSRPVRRS